MDPIDVIQIVHLAFNKFTYVSVGFLFFFVCTTQKYQFTAEDLKDKGHLGEGAFGTVSKMLFNKTETLMAVKVNTVDLSNYQGSPHADIKAECVGVVWAEILTTSIDSLLTSKINGVTLLKGPGENTGYTVFHAEPWF